VPVRRRTKGGGETKVGRKKKVRGAYVEIICVSKTFNGDEKLKTGSEEERKRKNRINEIATNRLSYSSPRPKEKPGSKGGNYVAHQV